MSGPRQLPTETANAQTWRAHLRQGLVKLQQLPRTADEWSPRRPTGAAVEVAETIADAITQKDLPIPIVVATAEGGLQVKWRAAQRELSFFISTRGRAEYLLVKADGKVEDGDLEIGRVASFVDWLLE